MTKLQKRMIAEAKHATKKPATPNVAKQYELLTKRMLSL